MTEGISKSTPAVNVTPPASAAQAAITDGTAPNPEPDTTLPLVALGAAKEDQEALETMGKEAARLNDRLEELRRELEKRLAAEDVRAVEDAEWFERELAQEKELKARNAD